MNLSKENQNNDISKEGLNDILGKILTEHPEMDENYENKAKDEISNLLLNEDKDHNLFNSSFKEGLSIISGSLNISKWDAYRLVNSISKNNSKEGIKRIVVNKYPKAKIRGIPNAVTAIYESRKLFVFRNNTNIIIYTSMVVAILISLFIGVEVDIDGQIGIAILIYFLFAIVLGGLFGPTHKDDFIQSDKENNKDIHRIELFQKEQPKI